MNEVMKRTKKFAAVTAGMAMPVAVPALAVPQDRALGYGPAATEFAEEVHFFHDIVLMPVITFISLFVLSLLLWIVIRYNSKANPTPRKFSHNTAVEIIWTVVPILILAYISLFSFDILFKEAIIPDGRATEFKGGTGASRFTVANDFNPGRHIRRAAHVEVFVTDTLSGDRAELAHRADYTLSGLGADEVTVVLSQPLKASEVLTVVGGRSRSGVEPFMGIWGEDRSTIITAPTLTIKATGRQWGWDYAYPKFGDLEFSANMVQKDDPALTPGLYLLQATENVVVPAGETIRLLTTASDVIHSWTIPAFAIKIDAVPGRINETWFRAPKTPQTLYGQCSEICGKDHAFMPIAVEVKSRADFEAWVNERLVDDGGEPFFTAQNPKVTRNPKVIGDSDVTTDSKVVRNPEVVRDSKAVEHSKTTGISAVKTASPVRLAESDPAGE